MRKIRYELAIISIISIIFSYLIINAFIIKIEVLQYLSIEGVLLFFHYLHYKRKQFLLKQYNVKQKA
jgi:hypothetical protein